MAKTGLMETVVSLRKKGFTYGEIIKKTGATKGSISNWCRDITLSKEQADKIRKAHTSNAVAALMRVADVRRQIRNRSIKKWKQAGTKDIKGFSERDKLFLGLGLYWGEGYKHGNEEFGITNSDPKMVSFAVHWLKACYGIDKEELTLRISVNEVHKNRVAEIEQYWQKVIGVDSRQFTKTSLIKSEVRKVYSNNSLHFGTIRVKVRRGTNLRRRIMGSIEKIREMY